MTTEMELLKQIYMKPGMYVRSLSRELKVGIPSIKYELDKLLSKKVITSRKEGRNLKFYVNFSNKMTVPCLYNVEYSRVSELPKNVQDAVFHFLEFLQHKPVLTLVFGSYARGDYKKGSDLDVLVVFSETIDKRIEQKSKIISSRHGISFEPVYLSWDDFSKRYFDRSDSFMSQIRKDKILINGIEWWTMLERFGAGHDWKEMV